MVGVGRVYDPVSSWCPGQKNVLGVLKVLGRGPVKRERITEAEFVQHRPASWGTRLKDFERFYRISAAQRVDILFDELLNRKGRLLDARGMHDMVFVETSVCDVLRYRAQTRWGADVSIDDLINTAMPDPDDCRRVVPPMSPCTRSAGVRARGSAERGPRGLGSRCAGTRDERTERGRA